MAKTPKTNKSVRKRLKITGKNKFLRRPAGRDHFNAKYPGNMTRSKKRQQEVENKKSISKFKELLPFN